ncbi:MAG: methyltransferase [Bacteroidales bacterium]|jgi:tRNA1Val (adenine37-N6)-methyltransferase
MANDYFQFKKFMIRQDKCAMKVGTDGVLLGAWATVENTRRVLDIGTGTGLIAIMLAQRSNAFVDAIEIDETAANQAKENSLESPWDQRVRIYNLSLQDFLTHYDLHYDLIVSNPPYYSNSYCSPDRKRKLARQDEMLNTDDLFIAVSKMLSDRGRFATICPADMPELLEKTARSYGLYPVRMTEVIPVPDKPSKRILIEFSFNEMITEKNAITIEVGSRHDYSKEYIALTKDFYLKF